MAGFVDSPMDQWTAGSNVLAITPYQLQMQRVDIKQLEALFEPPAPVELLPIQ